MTSLILPNAQPIIPLIVFACIVVPLSCCDLTEQVSVQVFMFFLRFFVLALLIFGTIAAILIDPYGNDNNTILLPISTATTYPYFSNDIPLVNFAGFGAMFSTALFSQLFQHSVPGLIRPLSKVCTIFLKKLIWNISQSNFYILGGKAWSSVIFWECTYYYWIYLYCTWCRNSIIFWWTHWTEYKFEFCWVFMGPKHCEDRLKFAATLSFAVTYQ